MKRVQKWKQTRIYSTKPHWVAQDALGLERIIFFSDAVFAIATTLLALELRLPEGDGLLDRTQLTAQLASMWQEYTAFFLSFMGIGSFWIAHHRKFRYIKRYDNRLMMFNLLFLLVIAFIPFPSAVISRYPDFAATAFYAATMAMAGLLLTGLWWYASRKNRLVDPGIDPRINRYQFAGPLLASTIFLLSIVIAHYSGYLSRLSWLLILFVSWFSHSE